MHVKFSSVPDIGNNVFLNFCLFLLLKSDPLVYLMVPYYPGASLRALQADTPLTLQVSVTDYQHFPFYVFGLNSLTLCCYAAGGV